MKTLGEYLNKCERCSCPSKAHRICSVCLDVIAQDSAEREIADFVHNDYDKPVFAKAAHRA